MFKVLLEGNGLIKESKAVRKMPLWEAFVYTARITKSEYVLRFLESEIDLFISIYERSWSDRPRQREVLFPESPTFIDQMERSTYSGVSIEDLPTDYFSVAVPDGSNIPPFFVAFSDKDESEYSFRKISNELKIPETAKPKFNTVGEKMLSIAFCSDNENGDPGHVFHTYNISNLSDLIESKTVDDAMQKINPNIFKSNTSQSYAEQYLGWRMAKIAMSIMLFKQAFPEKIKAGPPPLKAQKAMGKEKFSAILTEKGLSPMDAAQVVGFHMRCLRDDRYYQSPEWREKPRGTRFVSVESYMKGGSASSVENETTQPEV